MCQTMCWSVSYKQLLLWKSSKNAEEMDNAFEICIFVSISITMNIKTEQYRTELFKYQNA